MHAAHLAEIAARDAAEASAAARAAASYARRLAAADRADRAITAAAACHRPNSHPSSPHVRSHPRGVVRPVPLGKLWSFDLVAIWHNAIRMELRDLDEIIWGLIDGGRPINLHELRGLFAWFSTFEAFVVTCLKAEEEVLFPWLEQWGRIDGDLSTASRITTKGTIIRGIRDTAACAALVGLDQELPEGMVLTNPHRNYYDGLKVGFAQVKPALMQRPASSVLYKTVLERVATHVSSFSTKLLDYFQEQERSLPMIIDSLYDVEDMHAMAVERRMIRAIWKCGRKDESMIILLRAVENAPFHRQWTVRNLKRVERLAMPLWRRRYNMARGAVTAKFRERNLHWERMASSLDVVFTSYDGNDGGERRSSPLHNSSTHLSSNLRAIGHSHSLDPSSTMRSMSTATEESPPQTT